MIYKIQGDFKINLSNIIDHLKLNYNILFCNNNLYISPKDIDSITNFKKYLKPAKNFFIVEINENNLKYESEQVIEWCKDNFVRLEAERFEKEKQEELQKILKFLDDLDKNLDEIILNEEEGGNPINGENKQNNGRGTKDDSTNFQKESRETSEIKKH